MVASKIAASEAVRLVREHGPRVVVDVRTPVEVRSQMIEGALCIPLEELSTRLEEVRSIEGPGAILCRSGKRAEMAQRTLAEHGLDHLAVVEGGIQGYAAAGGSTVEGAASMSLERQVRIAAGLLVLVGVILGTLVHPGLYGLAAFVGAGLVFAGVTDYCGMGLLLARMPWNRVTS